jgi:hypothetical protein
MAERRDDDVLGAPFAALPPPVNDAFKLATLALQADTLTKELDSLQGRCAHESTSVEISTAANELRLLAIELSNLDKAVKANKNLYTTAFDQDLREIQNDLEGIFEDVADCCQEMQKANSLNVGTLGWLTKKRYVKKLQKRLQAHKTTLTVMRTVLHHGKEYGRQK